MATNLITVPIYRVNSAPFDGLGTTSIVYYRNFALPATGIAVQPVGTPNNVVNGALIYSAIKTPAFGDAVLYSNLTVAQVITLANA
jgi:hypothetical protein